MRHERCGNAGAVESVESQEQASHSFHEPLGNLANSGRDSHIPTAPTTRAMEKWKTKSRFSTFPPPRGYIGKTNEKPRRAGFALRPPNAINNNERRLVPATWTSPFSGSRRIGIELPFQAHGVLESILDFRLICGLEYAGRGRLRRAIRYVTAHVIVNSRPLTYNVNMALTRKNPAAVALGRRGGKIGGPARAAKLTPEQRSESARKAVQARWAKGDEGSDTSRKALHLCLDRIKKTKDESELRRLTVELQRIVFHRQYQNAEN